MSVSAMALAAALTGSLVEGGGAGERILRAEVLVPAAVEEVWAAWTTDGGVRTFFAPGSHVEPAVDGAYEIFFDPEAPPGRRGGDGMRVLVYEPPRRLSFTWNAPLTQPAIRGQRTVVTLELRPAGARRTLLTFTHAGWGEGPDWDAAYAYFDRAWSTVVLPRLVHRFQHGPVDWSRPPQVSPIAPSLKVTRTVR